LRRFEAKLTGTWSDDFGQSPHQRWGRGCAVHAGIGEVSGRAVTVDNVKTKK